MNKLRNVVLTVAMLGFTFPATGWGADPCPAELGEAKAALKSAQAAAKKATSTAKSQAVQAPRTIAGAKTPTGQPQRLKEASGLIREADAACKKGDTALSTQKAKEALALLK